MKEQEANLNRKLQDVRDAFDSSTKSAREEKLSLEQDIELFCIENKDQFEKLKSKDYAHGKIGFRFGKPKLALLNRKYNWDTVVELVKKIIGVKYLRPKVELNKEQMLADASGDNRTLTDEQLAAVGTKIDQEERFYYEIKWEEFEKQNAGKR